MDSPATPCHSGRLTFLLFTSLELRSGTLIFPQQQLPNLGRSWSQLASAGSAESCFFHWEKGSGKQKTSAPYLCKLLMLHLDYIFLCTCSETL